MTSFKKRSEADLNSESVVPKTNALNHWVMMIYNQFIDKNNYTKCIFIAILWRRLKKSRTIGVMSHLKYQHSLRTWYSCCCCFLHFSSIVCSIRLKAWICIKRTAAMSPQICFSYSPTVGPEPLNQTHFVVTGRLS